MGGIRGDRLWVQERWGYNGCSTGGDPEKHAKRLTYLADNTFHEVLFKTCEEMFAQPAPKQVLDIPQEVIDRYENEEIDGYEYNEHYDRALHQWWDDQRNKPAETMYRWGSRFLLRVEYTDALKLHDLSNLDVRFSGCPCTDHVAAKSLEEHGSRILGYYDGFRTVWNSVYRETEYRWSKNPWVWRVSFEILEAPNKES